MAPATYRDPFRVQALRRACPRMAITVRVPKPMTPQRSSRLQRCFVSAYAVGWAQLLGRAVRGTPVGVEPRLQYRLLMNEPSAWFRRLLGCRSCESMGAAGLRHRISPDHDAGLVFKCIAQRGRARLLLRLHQVVCGGAPAARSMHSCLVCADVAGGALNRPGFQGGRLV